MAVDHVSSLFLFQLFRDLVSRTLVAGTWGCTGIYGVKAKRARRGLIGFEVVAYSSGWKLEHTRCDTAVVADDNTFVTLFLLAQERLRAMQI